MSTTHRVLTARKAKLLLAGRSWLVDRAAKFGIVEFSDGRTSYSVHKKIYGFRIEITSK